jgi:hypothetical protein
MGSDISNSIITSAAIIFVLLAGNHAQVGLFRILPVNVLGIDVYLFCYAADRVSFRSRFLSWYSLTLHCGNQAPLYNVNKYLLSTVFFNSMPFTDGWVTNYFPLPLRRIKHFRSFFTIPEGMSILLCMYIHE